MQELPASATQQTTRSLIIGPTEAHNFFYGGRSTITSHVLYYEEHDKVGIEIVRSLNNPSIKL